MKTIELKGHTFELKNLESQYNRYLFSDKHELSECYGSWSVYKQRAYDRCVNLAFDCECNSFGNVSYNSQMFTFGFTFVCNDHIWYAHITRYQDYVMRLD